MADKLSKTWGNNHVRACRDVKNHKQACLAAITKLKADAKEAGDALQTIGKLVADKQEGPARPGFEPSDQGGRPDEDAVPGDLQEENRKLKAAVADMIDKTMTMGVASYFDKTFANMAEIERAIKL